MSNGNPAAAPEAFLVAQESFSGTLGELAWALRNGTLQPAAVDLLALVRSWLEHFEAASRSDLELASAALPQVAQVVELKLRLLLPRPPREVEEEAEEELEEAARTDPIARMRNLLEREGLLDADLEAAVEDEAKRASTALRDAIYEAPHGDPMELFEHVYVDRRGHLEDHETLLRAELDAEAAAGEGEG